MAKIILTKPFHSKGVLHPKGADCPTGCVPPSDCVDENGFRIDPDVIKKAVAKQEAALAEARKGPEKEPEAPPEKTKKD